MASLAAITCPNCHGTMSGIAIEGAAPAAKSFDDCLRRCESCGIAASNAANSDTVTFIHQDVLANIPAEIREGASEALDKALNVRNRQTKRQRFGFSTSEDAVTWVVFTQLLRSGQLRPVLQKLGMVSETVTQSPRLLLWGVPVDSSDGTLRQRLTELSTNLKEDPQSFSEPDVIIDLGADGLIFIEVKYRSGNDLKPPDYPGWNRYFPAADRVWNEAAVRASGCYELARNWRLLTGLAKGRSATLVNLGPTRLFSGGNHERLCRFMDALGQDASSRFITLTWPDLMGAISDKATWFEDYCHLRKLYQ